MLTYESPTKMVSVKRGSTGPIIQAGNQVWPLEIEVVSVGDMPDEILVFRKKDDGADEFWAVASAPQLEEMGSTRETGDPFYRQSKATIYCRSSQEAVEVWGDILEDIEDVAASYQAWKRLKQDLSVDVFSSGISVTTHVPEPSVIDISYHPEGVALETNGVQTIDTEEESLQDYYSALIDNYPASAFPSRSGNSNISEGGWLPINFLPKSFSRPVPENAKFWYNIGYYPRLSKKFPLPQPFNVHQLRLNGYILPHGVVYQVTGDTIFWLDFVPGSIEGGFPKAGNAPWPTDYTNSTSPGDEPPVMSLTIF